MAKKQRSGGGFMKSGRKGKDKATPDEYRGDGFSNFRRALERGGTRR
jgi:hypothetical protein